MPVHNRQTKHAPSSYYENLSVPLFTPNRLGEGEGAGEGGRVRVRVRARVRVRVAAGLTEPTWLSPWLL